MEVGRWRLGVGWRLGANTLVGRVGTGPEKETK